MFIRQKGVLFLFSRLFGIATIVYPSFAILMIFLPKLFARNNRAEFLVYFLFVLSMVLFPVGIGWLLLNLFPAIKVSDAGIKHTIWPLTTHLITWENIESIRRFKNGYGALVVQQKSIYWGSMWSNKLYGLIVGIIDPVIFLSPGVLCNAHFQNTLLERKIYLY
jgi:hypothetical protein